MNSQKLILAAIASAASAHTSVYFSDFAAQLEQIEAGENCNNGPRICGTDSTGAPRECSEGFVCNDLTSNFATCRAVIRFHCHETCPQGQTLSPLGFCTCIGIDERDAMFCNPGPVASEPVESPVVPDPTEIISAPEPADNPSPVVPEPAPATPESDESPVTPEPVDEPVVPTPPVAPVVPSEELTCTDTLTTDSFGDGCEWYLNRTRFCGRFDDSDFVANTMCCACISEETLQLARLAALEAVNSVDQNCAPRGSVNFGFQQFRGQAYQSQSASAKMNQLWNMINRERTVICQQIGDLDDLYDENPIVSFRNRDSDQMPTGRAKLLHQQGLVAQARFIAEPDSPYTGVFEGAEHVLIRMSQAEIIVDDVNEGLNPSIALKFLRDGRNSANEFGMVTFEHTKSWNWFESPFMTHLPQFEEECLPKTLHKFFSTVTQFGSITGSDDMCEFAEDGRQEFSRDLPYFMMFVPRPGLPVTNEDSPWFEQLEGDAIPSGTILFDVIALDEAPNTATPWTSPNLFKIGEIQTKTTFTQSLWGDERLFFSHVAFNQDIQERAEFLNARTVRFPNNEFGNWPTDPNFAGVRNVSESQIINGLEQGCPF